MLKTIILAENALDPSTWESFEAEDVRDFLMTKFDKFPDTARIYHKHVAESCDVTPSDEWGIKRLGELEGPFYVVVYPGDPVTIIVAVVAVAAVAAAVYLLRPSVPTPSLRNTQSESPNNELSDRQNRPRPGGRIPDIFGTVRSTPDLLAVPYKVFENHEEVEYAYMCIGRGEYDVPAAEVKDDTTLISDIAGASVEVFAPFTSPNSGDDPQLRIGTAISEPLYSAVRSNAVNGQVLRPPNADSVSGNNDIKFVSPDEIRINTSAETDFTTFFAASDSLTISNASYTGTIPGSGVSQNVSVRFTATGTIEFETTDTTAFSVGDTLIVSGAFFTYNGGLNAINLDGTYVISGKTTSVLTLSSPENINTDWNLIAGNFTDDKTGYKTCGLVVPAGQTTIDLAGTYTILSVSSSTIVLSNPAAVNSDWNTLANFDSGETAYISPILETSGSKWVGPFTLDKTDLDRVFSNFVALNGLYKDDGEKQIRFDVTVELELTPVDLSGTPTGAAETFQAVIQGSAKTKSTRAITIKATPTFTGRCEVRARRVTNADLDFEGSVIDEIKWRDVYSMSPVVENDFGNVTTVHSVTYATAGALAVKDRKLNMLVTRKIPLRQYDRFLFPLNWTSYAGGVPILQGNALTVSSDGDSYGTYGEIDNFTNGQVVTVKVNFNSSKSTATTVRMGLHNGSSFASNDVTLTPGENTYVLTADETPADCWLVFFCAQSGTYFTVEDIEISGVTYPSNQTMTSAFGGVLSNEHGGKVVASDGDSYGASVPTLPVQTGETITLSFEIGSQSTATAIRVGIHNGTAYASADVTVGAGAHTLTFTATESPASPRILFFCAQAGTEFVVKDLLVKGNYSTNILYDTKQADDIISAICLDSYIGRRSESEIDFASIYSTVEEIQNYFGSEGATEFCYTFDSDNISFEETIASIASAIYSNAFRQGNVIKMRFEQETEDSTLLFNHRNKVPGSETRTVRFGNQDDNDGVEYEYVDPEDDSIVTFYLPYDKSATNPKKIESLGVRNKLQAHFHAWRIWNKIRYQNLATEFEATQEADLLVLSDRILNADNTRPGIQDGEVYEQNGLELTLSQRIDLTKYASYSIFIQHYDGSVESISISAGSADNKVLLASAPKAPLALGDNLYARATYLIVGNAEVSPTAFLVTEKVSQSNFTSQIKAVNYDSRYYSNDSDFKRAIIDESGDLL